MVRDEPGYGRLLDRLQEGVDAGALLCPASAEHRSESTLADKGLWAALDELADRLSLGIEFHSRDEVEARELAAAAAEFSGCAPDGELWEEAFTANPHTSRDELFTEFLGGHIRVRAVLPPIELEQQEATRQKAIAERMNEAYEELRRAGFSFEELAEANLQGMFTWKLGPLLDQTGFSRELAIAQRNLADGPSSLTLGASKRLPPAWRGLPSSPSGIPQSPSGRKTSGPRRRFAARQRCAIRHYCAPRSRPLATARRSLATS